jgi:N-methylhydantoinase A
MTRESEPRGLLGIDIGGSFTDVVSSDPTTGTLLYGKTATYPDDLVRSLRESIAEVDAPLEEIAVLRHGTTVVINTILTSSGSKTALLTTQGFRDVLEIGRTNWPEPYNLFYDRLPPLVPRDLRFEVVERMSARGDVVVPLDEDALVSAMEIIRDEEVSAVAVCLLHAYVNPAHEIRVAQLLAEHVPDVYVSLSHELSKEFREYERTSTAVTNAYVGDVVDEYIDEFESHLASRNFAGSLYLMESNGGVTTAAVARRKPVVMVESGPAAGVMATAAVARELDIERAVAFDMGGTTAKACLVEGGDALFTSQYYVPDYEHGYPLQVAALDIVEVGTGGGSIASVDDVGVLSVGPASAGAVPGPACYGMGGDAPTVTDANLVLGRLNPERFLDGSMVLDIDRAGDALRRLADALDADLVEIALGVTRLANFNMAAAIRRVSLERGRDPREFVLVAYGGAGPLHAVELARDLAIPRVIVPVMPGIFSALGMLLAELRQDFTRTFLADLGSLTPEALAHEYRDVERQAHDWEDELGSDVADSRTLRFADCRYKGQEFTILVPVGDLDSPDALAQVRGSFETEYELRYGHAFPELPVETVNLRAVAYVALPKPDLATLGDAVRADFSVEETRRPVCFEAGSFVDTRVVDRRSLEIGDEVRGPLVIEEYGSTTLVGPDDSVSVDELRQLVIDIGVTASTDPEGTR